VSKDHLVLVRRAWLTTAVALRHADKIREYVVIEVAHVAPNSLHRPDQRTLGEMFKPEALQ